jgi:hypothetical protein
MTSWPPCREAPLCRKSRNKKGVQRRAKRINRDVVVPLRAGSVAEAGARM